MENVDSISNKFPDWATNNDKPGLKLASGPYIGKIKENRDPLRLGRLQVYIADLGGIENDVTNWRTIMYASPYLGTTDQELRDPDFNQPGPKENSFTKVRHTYGMWFTVPDIGNLVLLNFVLGDPQRGYWYACIPNQIGRHMIPGIGHSADIDSSKIEDPTLQDVIESGQPYPVVEYNEQDNPDFAEFLSWKKPIHERQIKTLLEQGLDRFRLTGTRGSISSSSHRESPSGVFGISTPGASPIPIESEEDAVQVPYRLGGHTFVMDDGNADGENNLVRIKTANGHTVLMDDNNQLLYIINANGSTYLEMDQSGHITVYASNTISFRTKSDFNIHSDKDINIHAEGSLNVLAKSSIKMQSTDLSLNAESTGHIYSGVLKLGADGRLDLYTPGGGSFTASGGLLHTGGTIGLNSGAGPSVSRPSDIPINSHAETEKDGKGQWQVRENQLKSICTIAASHEPWPRQVGVQSSLSNSTGVTRDDEGNPLPQVADPDKLPSQIDSNASRQPVQVESGGILKDSQGNPVLSGTRDAGIDDAQKNSMKKDKLASPADMSRKDAPTGTKIGPLSEMEVKALKTQIAKTESNFNYGVVNTIGYVGRYQFGAQALVDRGYISRAAYEKYGGSKGGNKVLDDPSAWTGKDGATSKDVFLKNPAAQEKCMDEQLQANYSDAVRRGAIKQGDGGATVSGVLATSHLLGVGGAKKWREGSGGKDAYGTTGSDYFNFGTYANKTLAKGP